MMKEMIKEIKGMGIIPVVVINDVSKALPLAKALCDGGLPCAEVTFRTAEAEESIKIMSEAFPNMLIGAGTILTTEQVDKAVAAGAKFIVSPGLNLKVVKYCLEKKIPVIPGIVTPTEAETAIELGLKAVKFFPAEPSGGLPMIKALSAPYTMLEFMPTGGINPENVSDYLKFDKIIACGGSWMVSDKLVNNDDFDEIERLSREAKKLVLEIRG